MKTVSELFEQRSILDKEFETLVAKETPTNEEAQRMDAITTEAETLAKDIEAAEKREALLKDVEQRKKSQSAGFAINLTKTDNEKQVKQNFRFTEVIKTLADKKPIEGFYKEVLEAGRRDLTHSGINNDENGYVVPAFIIGNEKRDMSTSTGDTSKAGYTIATDLLANEWIDVLRNSLVMTQLGTRMMTGLQGNIAIPKKTSDSGATWLTETGAITPADAVFNQVTMTPKRLGNATAFTYKLLAQSSLDIEALVRQDLVISQALALESAAIKGAIGGENPIGILNTSGIGSVAIGTNGGALTWAAVVGLETAVANNNALLNTLGYLTNSRVKGSAKSIFKDTGSGLTIWGDNGMNSYKVAVTNAVPNTNVKGSSGAVCSSLIFGNWADLMIGQWGGLVLTANPYALDLSGQVRVTVNSFYDIAVRNAVSFAACNDITT